MDSKYFPVYFNDWNAIRSAVTSEQGWTLFTRCLDYAMGEPLPAESDPVINAFFTMLSGGIDRGKAKMESKAQKRRYARYCGVLESRGETPLTFEEWAETVDICQHVSTGVDIADNRIESKSKSESKSESKSDRNKPPKRFVPPTLEEVQAYCLERGNRVDAKKFWEYYDKGDWKDSKGQQVKNWKQKLLTWEHYNESSRGKNQIPDTTNPFLALYREEFGT